MVVINWINGEGSGIWGERLEEAFQRKQNCCPWGGRGGQREWGVMRELGGGTQLNMDEEKLS